MRWTSVGALALAIACSTADRDKDGYSAVDGDCDDNDASVNPGATEVWYDGVDQDCDGNDDDQDGDGSPIDIDCADDDDTIEPGTPEVLGDAVDQDCDGDPNTSPFELLDLGGNSSITGVGLAKGTRTWVATMAQVSDDDTCAGVRVPLSTKAPAVPGVAETRDINPYRCGTGFDSTGFEDLLAAAFTMYWDEGNLTLIGMFQWLSDEEFTAFGFGWPPTSVPDWSDTAIWTDQELLSAVGCDEDHVAFLIGTSADFQSGNYENVGDLGSGGVRCDIREGTLYLLDEDGNLTVAQFDGASSLDTVSETAGSYDDVAVTDERVVLGDADGLTVERDGASETVPTAAHPHRIAVADDGDAVWVAYASTDGDAYLVWNDGAGWSEVALVTGLSSVEDVDLFADSEAVVIAVQDGDDLAVSGVAR